MTRLHLVSNNGTPRGSLERPVRAGLQLVPGTGSRYRPARAQEKVARHSPWPSLAVAAAAIAASGLVASRGYEPIPGLAPIVASPAAPPWQQPNPFAEEIRIPLDSWQSR